MQHRLLMICFLLSTSLLSTAIIAEQSPLKVGDMLADISLQNQFEKPLKVTSETQVLLFSRDMDGGEVVQAAFDATPENQRPAKLIYVADLSGMPSLIAQFIAVPKMQDYSFMLGLDREGDITARLPAEKDQATIIKLNQLKVISIEYAQDAQSLMAQW
ncbi:hypothetical protein [Shewanella sp. OMA3-2]|uniref:hypothetical protein n=1 Tax=Shewanella sp. OMA3-2 TaxID=2908650 RepID=UPI001F45C906|nr:hypothetical protein [Shewanella sp. OMA3-2]UJF21885.1 hypothetical protein L0B17_17970 [Shewanella sp. OMA3-2]